MRPTITKRERSCSAEVTVLCIGPSTEYDVICKTIEALGFLARIVTSVESLAVDGCAKPRLLVLVLASQEVPKQLLFSTLGRNRVPTLAIFVSTACDWDEDIAAWCTDFTIWPCHKRELGIRLANLSGFHLACAEGSALESIVDERIALNILGESPAFQSALRSIRVFASCDAPVLIEGETGTGKEMASRAIHYFSARRGHPFVPIACGAIPDSLLENELFGHERGAYTDAKACQFGLVAQAQGGTLFLDEVDTLSPRVQAAILRFLETHEYRPLGGGPPRTADVRIIAATNVDLQELVSRRQFRADLFFRLNVLSVRLPPLADRGVDIRLLAEHFVRECSGLYGKAVREIHPETINWMERYRWPGNIRELQNLMQRECLLASGSVLRIDDRVNSGGGGEREGRVGHGPETFRFAKANAIQEFEKHYLDSVMTECGGNVSKAARRAGKERRSLGRLLKKYRIGYDCDEVPKY